MSKENKNSTEKTRKKLIKLIRKFNKSQSNYVAVGGTQTIQILS